MPPDADAPATSIQSSEATSASGQGQAPGKLAMSDPVSLAAAFAGRRRERIAPHVLDPVGILQLGAEARRPRQAPDNFLLLLSDGVVPTVAAACRLELLLEPVRQQHRHSAGQLATLALAHVLDLVRDVLDVEQVKQPGAQQPGLLDRPRHDIPVIAHTCGAWLRRRCIKFFAFTALPWPMWTDREIWNQHTPKPLAPLRLLDTQSRTP